MKAETPAFYMLQHAAQTRCQSASNAALRSVRFTSKPTPPIKPFSHIAFYAGKNVGAGRHTRFFFRCDRCCKDWEYQNMHANAQFNGPTASQLAIAKRNVQNLICFLIFTIYPNPNQELHPQPTEPPIHSSDPSSPRSLIAFPALTPYSCNYPLNLTRPQLSSESGYVLSGFLLFLALFCFAEDNHYPDFAKRN